jgi:hypothetical protein
LSSVFYPARGPDPISCRVVWVVSWSSGGIPFCACPNRDVAVRRSLDQFGAKQTHTRKPTRAHRKEHRRRIDRTPGPSAGRYERTLTVRLHLSDWAHLSRSCVWSDLVSSRRRHDEFVSATARDDCIRTSRLGWQTMGNTRTTISERRMHAVQGSAVHVARWDESEGRERRRACRLPRVWSPRRTTPRVGLLHAQAESCNSPA